MERCLNLLLYRVLVSLKKIGENVQTITLTPIFFVFPSIRAKKAEILKTLDNMNSNKELGFNLIIAFGYCILWLSIFQWLTMSLLVVLVPSLSNIPAENIFYVVLSVSILLVYTFLIRNDKYKKWDKEFKIKKLTKNEKFLNFLSLFILPVVGLYLLFAC